MSVIALWAGATMSDYIAVKPLAPGGSPLRHTCPDGHNWTEQPDGCVSPSYGLGGTRLTWEGYDPKTCPEPERGWSIYSDAEGNEVGPSHGIKCPSCGAVFYTGSCEGPRGTTYAEQFSGGVCEPPAPACRKPAVATARWMAVKTWLHREIAPGRSERYEGWTRAWVPIDEAGQPTSAVREPSLF